MTLSVSTLHYFINAKLTLINVEREDLPPAVDLSDSEVEFLGNTQLSNSRIIQKNSPRPPTPPSPRTDFSYSFFILTIIRLAQHR